MAHLCETNGGDEADVSGAYNCNWNWFAHSEWEGDATLILSIEDIRLLADFNEQKGLLTGESILPLTPSQVL
jgi:hypothetical protein